MSFRPAWWLAVLARIWPLTWISARMTRWPVVGRVVAWGSLPLFAGKNLNITYLPVNEEVGGTANTLLPRQVVEALIRRSAHRVIINRCTCRDAKSCRRHPATMGCTLLGEGTKEIDPRIARHATVEEALAHLDDALREGLIPMTGRVRIDNFIWGVKDRGKLLTICYCCRCCCTIMNSGRYLPAEAQAAIHPLAGLTISVDPDLCVRCGACVEECFMGAIRLEDGEIVHDAVLCKGCGRCAAVCPQAAIRVVVADVNRAVAELMGRIDSLVRYE